MKTLVDVADLQKVADILKASYYPNIQSDKNAALFDARILIQDMLDAFPADFEAEYEQLSPAEADIFYKGIKFGVDWAYETQTALEESRKGRESIER